MFMNEKNGADLLKECLEQINEDIIKADSNLLYGCKEEARINLANATRAFEKFLDNYGIFVKEEEVP